MVAPPQAAQSVKAVDPATTPSVGAVGVGAYPARRHVDPLPPNTVVIAGRRHTVNGVNGYRCLGCLTEYTRVAGATTGTNAFGTEVAVVDGKVRRVQSGVGSMRVPASAHSYVLSGHGRSATWLSAYAPVGARVMLHKIAGAPSPLPPWLGKCPSGQVTVGAQTHVITGVDVARLTNYLVVYTPAFGASTGTNEFGFEATVVGGKVTEISDGLGDTPIPSGGCVLSGHGEARTWLKTFAIIGADVR